MRTLRVSLAWVLFSLLVVLGALPPRAPVDAATGMPTGFTEELVASGLASPTAMQFAPDGRLFVCEQGGRLRVIENGVLLATAVRDTDREIQSGERGLLGVAFDPGFRLESFRLRLLHGARHRPSTIASAVSPPTATWPSPAAKP